MCSSRIVPCLRYLVFLQHLQHPLWELLLFCVFSLARIVGPPSLSTAQPSVNSQKLYIQVTFYD